MELLTTMSSDEKSTRSKTRRASLSPHELSMNLRALGFSTWKDLEPSKFNL